WRRVVRVPGEIAEQSLGLVAGAERNAMVARREIEERKHADTRHHVAATRAVGVGLVGQEAVNRGGDIDGPRFDAERVNHELRVRETLRARSPVGKTQSD